MTFLESLRQANIKRNKLWDVNNVQTLSYRGNELAGEVGELCNQLKKIERKRLGLRGSPPDMDIVKEEIGDILICLDLICMTLGIDLEIATTDKFNKTSKKIGIPITI